MSRPNRKISSGETGIEIRGELSDSFKIVNMHTGESISESSQIELLVRTLDELSEPVFLSMSSKRESVSRDGYSLKLSDSTKKYRVRLSISQSHHGLRFHIDVSAPKIIWLIECKINGLLLDSVIVPALGGQCLDKSMPANTTISYKYPFWWSAQFVVGQTLKGGILIFSRDPGPNLKMLRVIKGPASFALTLGFEAEGPLRGKKLAAEWYLDCFNGDWKVAVDRYRQWMEKAFAVKLIDKNPHFPDWAKRINFVLEIWGMRRDRPHPHHTFEQIGERLKAFQKLHPPEQTMVYLPGFAEGGIDSHAPDYNPSVQLGGKREFNKLVDVAHDLGYKIMVHTNALAMTYSHPLYKKFKKHQVVDVFNRPQGWALDMDGDWLTEPYFAYMNPGAKAWGDLIEKVLGSLIKEFAVDAVFLDQTLLAFNVSRGPNFVSGMRNHIARLQKAFPNILFAGEGMHEQVVSVLPMAQIHGIDSITEVHGMEGISSWRQAHPVSTYLFGRYTRFVAHLLTKHPSNPIFDLQEEAYSKLGVVPALCLYDNEQPVDMPQVRKMIRRAVELKFYENQERNFG